MPCMPSWMHSVSVSFFSIASCVHNMSTILSALSNPVAALIIVSTTLTGSSVYHVGVVACTLSITLSVRSRIDILPIANSVIARIDYMTVISNLLPHKVSMYYHSRMSAILCASLRNHISSWPRVVSAAVPIRMPLVSIKLRGSFGIPFLFTVMPFSSNKSAASRPLNLATT